MTTEEFESDRIERALRDLHDEAVPVQGKTHVLEMMRSRRKLLPTRLVLAGATASIALGALLVWPQQKALAWQQVVSATLANKKFHSESFEEAPDGSGWKKAFDEWIDGPKWSFEGKSLKPTNLPRGKSMVRYDGKRMFYILHNSNSPTPMGVVSTYNSHNKFGSPAEKFSLSGLLKASTWMKINDVSVDAKLDGKDVLKYEGLETGKPHDRHAYYVDPSTKQIIRMEHMDENGKLLEYETIQSVDSVPDSQFEPPKSGVVVMDIDLEDKKRMESMAHGIPFGHGNILREVVLGQRDEVWLTWTGMPPNADGTPHASVEGYRVRRTYSPMHFPSEKNPVWPGKGTGAQYKGQPLWTIVLVMDRPVKGPVILDMPVLVPDKDRPIHDSKGAVVGYSSKQAGISKLRDVKVIKDFTSVLSSGLESLRSPLCAGSGLRFELIPEFTSHGGGLILTQQATTLIIHGATGCLGLRRGWGFSEFLMAIEWLQNAKC